MPSLQQTIDQLLVDPDPLTRVFALDVLVRTGHVLEPAALLEKLKLASKDASEAVAEKAKLSLADLLGWRRPRYCHHHRHLDQVPPPDVRRVAARAAALAAMALGPQFEEPSVRDRAAGWQERLLEILASRGLRNLAPRNQVAASVEPGSPATPARPVPGRTTLG